MRIALVIAFIAACGDSARNPDLEPNEQGTCSNLDAGVCRAEPRCQLAYADSFLARYPLHCLELRGGETTDAAVDAGCAEADYDACRMREDCSPVFWQDLGESDGPVGEPRYERCASESNLQ